ncbi:MAG: type II secretion system F family protein, partial [Candidatus Heimdallarchaeota archaeon]|nr:type II secretion system F family protein [Candidatus Heimdallarchaeota archaeon]MCK4253167.1 type II secretion system F family protein [Candidatus Heimdallarchaeota archaeon]
IIYWAIAIASGLILVTLGIVDVIATSQGSDFITILDINDFVILAIIVVIGIPTFLIVLREERRQTRIDENLPYLLREISNAQRTGMSLPRAIQESAKRHYGPLTPELRKMSSKITWGIPFSKAMTDFQTAVNTPLAQRATVLILEAERSGGNLEDIFEATENHIQTLLNLKKEREGAMKPYVMIVYASFIIFIMVIVILFVTFFIPFGSANISPDQTAGMFLLEIDLDTLEILFLHMLAVQGFFSGLVAGKMSKMSVKSGLMHSVVMMFIGWFAFKILIQPDNPLISINV